MKRIVGLFLILVSVFSFFSCEDSDGVSEEPHLIVKFQFDPNQVRLNNMIFAEDCISLNYNICLEGFLVYLFLL